MLKTVWNNCNFFQMVDGIGDALSEGKGRQKTEDGRQKTEDACTSSVFGLRSSVKRNKCIFQIVHDEWFFPESWYHLSYGKKEEKRKVNFFPAFSRSEQMIVMYLAGLLTCSVFDAFPSLYKLGQWLIDCQKSERTYSSGNCSGITPDSLFIFLFQ